MMRLTFMIGEMFNVRGCFTQSELNYKNNKRSKLNKDINIFSGKD